MAGPYNLTEIKTVDRDAYWPMQKEVLQYKYLYSGADKTVYAAVWEDPRLWDPEEKPQRRVLAEGEEAPGDNWYHTRCACRLCRPERD